MASLGMNFDATTVAPSSGFDIIPAGKYLGQIVTSEMCATKNGTGQYLKLQCEIIDGDHKGRRIFTNLNLINENPQAVEIANRDLSAICHAVGEMNVQDSEQLHFKEMVLTVKVRPAREQYGPQNEIGGYAPVSGGVPTMAARPATAAPQGSVRTATGPVGSVMATRTAAPAGAKPWATARA